MTNAVRSATADDVGACAAMVNNWIDASDWHPRLHTGTEVVEYFRTVVWKEQDILVAGTPPVGFLAMTGDNVITALYADPTRNGAGTALIHAAQAARPELSLWTHVPNTQAQSFYLKMGFDEVRRTDGENEEGVPDILYRWARA